MRQWLFALVLCMGVGVPIVYGEEECRTSGFVQEWTLYTRDNVTPVVEGLILHDASPEYGLFGFLSVADAGYRQAYAGPTFRPSPRIQLGFGAGLERNDDPIRWGSFLATEHGANSLLAVLEAGGSGTWYKLEAMRQWNTATRVGLMAQTDAGVGPRLEVGVGDPSFHVFVAPLYEWEDGVFNGLFGIRFDF